MCVTDIKLKETRLIQKNENIEKETYGTAH